MNKPLKTDSANCFCDVYIADEMDTYLTDLLAPLKEVFTDFKGKGKREEHEQLYKLACWTAIKSIAERLNW